MGASVATSVVLLVGLAIKKSVLAIRKRKSVSNLCGDVEASIGPSESLLALNANAADSFDTMRQTSTDTEMQLLTDHNADVPPCLTTNTDSNLTPVPR